MASATGEPGGAASADAMELEGDPFGAPPSTATKPCAVAGYRAPAGASLELVTRVRGAWLAVGLHNTGSAAVCAYSHIATHELQHDWLGVGYRDGVSAVRLRFSDDRDKSAAVSVEIAPGATSWVSFDVAAWRSRQVNGSGALPRGRIELAVSYDTMGETRVWAGHLDAQAMMVAP